MKVIMLNSTSVNGIICREDWAEDFLSKSGGDYFIRQAKEHGNVIFGRHAYDNIKKNLPRFDKQLESVLRVIVSADSSLKLDRGYHLASTPQAAIDIIKKAGQQVALLGGGASLNSSFLAAKLVDEVHLVAQPVIVSKGLSIVADGPDIKLSLLSSEVINDGELLLKYKVVK